MSDDCEDEVAKPVRPVEDILSQILCHPETPEQHQLLRMVEQDLKNVQVAVMVQALNAAVRANKVAMHALLVARWPVGQEMIDDPFMVVDREENGGYSLGMLGVINGMLGSLGMPRIAARWQHTVDKPDNFIGFQVAPPEA